ncbi:MAG: aminopeptidase N [Myxococcota bacterium]|jgi:aminopeptidase N
MACLSCWHGSAPALSSFAEPGVRAHYAPSRTTLIEHIELWLNLYPTTASFDGKARITLAGLPIYNGEVTLDLDEVEVATVVGPDGEPLSWQLTDGSLVIQSAECPSEVTVTWTGSHPRHGLYFTAPTQAFPDRPRTAWTQCQDEDGHFVFPCHDHPRSKHAWTIHLSGPEGHTLLSNGARIAEGMEAGRVMATFQQAEPMPAYLMTAVSAPLDIIDAGTADLAVRYLFPKGQAEAAKRSMGRTPDMIALFAERTGIDFPWARYDQVVVHDFVFGGMENIGCTTMTELLLVSEGAAEEWDPETLVAHELAHQWFGDLVTCIDWSHGWLNESWATYMESVWITATRPADEATWYRYKLARDYFAEADDRYVRAIVENRFREPIDVFDRHLYQKGASVLATLQSEIGEDAFWNGVRSYLAEHAHGSVHTVDFQRAIEDATGKNLGAFFEQWIHTPGHPVLQVTMKKQEGFVGLDLEQQQDGVVSKDAFAFILRVEVCFVDGTTQIVDLPVSERKRSIAIPVAKAVASVRVDPDFRVLAKLTLKGPRDWLIATTSDPCPVLAVRAARALLHTGHPAAVSAVYAAAGGHNSRFVRGELVGLLAARNDSVAEHFLVNDALSDPDVRVRRATCDALGGFRSESAAAALRDVIAANPKTPHLLGSALKSLGRTRQPNVVDVIAPHVHTGPTWADIVAGRALAGLAETRDADVFPHLFEAAGAAHRPRVRAAAFAALAELASHISAQNNIVREFLVDVLVEGGFRESLAAIDALKILGDSKALAALDTVHATAADGRVMRMAFEAATSIRRTGKALGVARQAQQRAEEVAREQAELRVRVDRLERVSTF